MFLAPIRIALEFRAVFPMSNRSYQFLIIAVLNLGMLDQTSAQTATRTAPLPAVGAERGLKLAEQGQCQEALPLLKKSTPRLTDKQLKYHAGMAIAKCAMSLNQTEAAVEALLWLRREFPKDPQVLYLSTHYYSELATGASEEDNSETVLQTVSQTPCRRADSVSTRNRPGRARSS